MVTPLDREQLLAAVERSPQAAAAHDRAGWVALFTGDGRIEDPVGSRPHVGRTQIGRFYDTFIGPRDIKFHRDLDIVFGTVVLRDLELEVAMGSAVTMYIPAFLRYDLREGNGQWQIAELRAYWELPAMMLQFLRTGSRAVSPAVQLSRGLLGNQGLRGTAGFMAGFRRVGARHKELVETFLDAVGAARQVRRSCVRYQQPPQSLWAIRPSRGRRARRATRRGHLDQDERRGTHGHGLVQLGSRARHHVRRCGVAGQRDQPDQVLSRLIARPVEARSVRNHQRERCRRQAQVGAGKRDVVEDAGP